MTDGMLARDALERKETWAFLALEIGGLLASSAEFRGLCWRMLESGRGCLEFEVGLRGAVLDGTARGLSEVLSALDGELDAPSCARCDSTMHRRGARSLSPVSLLGRLTLRRGYWTCRCSKGGVHLLDRALGIASRGGVRLTPAALRALAEEAAEKSFAKAAESLGRLAGVAVTAKRAERAAKQVGREIAAWERSAPALAEAPAETMYCSPDGTGVPMVRRDAGAAEDGEPSKTREAKVAVFHTAERANPRTGLPERDAGPARCTAAIDSARSKDADPEASPFARRVWRAAERFGFVLAKRQVVIGDGAKWIWNTAAELFPKAIRIVDIWHAFERLWEVGRALHGMGTRRCRAWSEKFCDALSQGRIDDVLRELRRHAGEPAAVEAVGYFENNRDRMRYPRYRAMGLLVGSGMVESSCGTLVAARFKRGGMRWSKAGANDILRLRACVRSGLYDGFRRQRRGPPTPAAVCPAHQKTSHTRAQPACSFRESRRVGYSPLFGQPQGLMAATDQPKFLAVDFYCGAGGTTRGLLDAGGYVIAGIDNDASCRETYERNNANDALDQSGPVFLEYDMLPKSAAYPGGQQKQVFGRLRDLVPASRSLAEEAPLLFAICAPCQAFTKFAQRHLTQGRADSRERDRSLLAQTLGFIDEFKPELVLCENVIGISRGASGRIWSEFLGSLGKRHYAVGADNVCASSFGVPQYRRRSFLMGIKTGSRALSAPLSVPRRAGDGAPISVKEAIGHLPPLQAGESNSGVTNHVCRNLRDINLRRLKYLKPGQPNFRLADAPAGDLSLACHRRLEKGGNRGFGDVYTRMRPDKPSPTITTRFVSVSNGRFGHFDQNQVRGISIREGAMLQSFPSNYRFFGAGIDANAKMIGNAVPPKLAAHMADHLVSAWTHHRGVRND